MVLEARNLAVSVGCPICLILCCRISICLGVPLHTTQKQVEGANYDGCHTPWQSLIGHECVTQSWAKEQVGRPISVASRGETSLFFTRYDHRIPRNCCKHYVHSNFSWYSIYHSLVHQILRSYHGYRTVLGAGFIGGTKKTKILPTNI